MRTLARLFFSGAPMVLMGQATQRFVAYPIGPRATDSGLATVNSIAELHYRPDYHWNKEDWNRKADSDTFLPAFDAWCFDWLDVPALVRCREAGRNLFLS